jgi:sugar lactone lactonase YvrE
MLVHSPNGGPMKTRLWGVLAGIIMLSFLAVTVTACGGTKKATARVSTLAGQSGPYGSADGSGAAARFNHPDGIARDAADNLYVVDAFNSTIRKITPAGEVTTLAGQAGSVGSADGSGSAARFIYPSGIACDAAGNLYVTDFGNTIRMITLAGAVTTLAGKAGPRDSADGSGAAARFYYPTGIAGDAAGNLYVADTFNSTIRKITPAGKVSTLAGTAGSLPGSADGSGTAARFYYPTGIACDAAGNLCVADTLNSTIRKITPAGKVTNLAGNAGSPGSADGSGAAARFNWPLGIACDAAGNLYVADTENHTIRKITPAGEVTTLVGQARSEGSADGRGAAARFSHPEGVACDAAGNLYVADTGNNTIRRITVSE